MYLGIVNTGYATSFFTPTILTQLGWQSIHAQVMSIHIFFVATVLDLTTAVVTDRLNSTPSLIGMVGRAEKREKGEHMRRYHRHYLQCPIGAP
jgi:hypothetical protein